jgi:hypothetical protein
VSGAVEELFEQVAARLLAEDPEVQQGRMLRAVGLQAGGKFFAYAGDGDLVVKLPAERVDELVATGDGRPFESGGRRMREWVRLRLADAASCAAHVAEARAFVAG